MQGEKTSLLYEKEYLERCEEVGNRIRVPAAVAAAAVAYTWN